MAQIVSIGSFEVNTTNKRQCDFDRKVKNTYFSFAQSLAFSRFLAFSSQSCDSLNERGEEKLPICHPNLKKCVFKKDFFFLRIHVVLCIQC